mmetsp:Transcript_30807/g.77841  ORF Transcript_30807/g.77841 Transcript_30807/m.77841 type:complete len:260 (-) Transcript_30807:1057-1836(-)
MCWIMDSANCVASVQRLSQDCWTSSPALRICKRMSTLHSTNSSDNRLKFCCWLSTPCSNSLLTFFTSAATSSRTCTTASERWLKSWLHCLSDSSDFSDAPCACDLMALCRSATASLKPLRCVPQSSCSRSWTCSSWVARPFRSSATTSANWLMFSCWMLQACCNSFLVFWSEEASSLCNSETRPEIWSSSSSFLAQDCCMFASALDMCAESSLLTLVILSDKICSSSFRRLSCDCCVSAFALLISVTTSLLTSAKASES